jgi:hypothetical protein
MAFAETSSNSHRAWKDPEQPKTILKRTRVLISTTKLQYLKLEVLPQRQTNQQNRLECPCARTTAEGVKTAMGKWQSSTMVLEKYLHVTQLGPH